MTVLAIAGALGISEDPDLWVQQACAEAEARIPSALADRDVQTLNEIHEGAVATYNRALREGHGQAVRLRAAETMRRTERAIGQAIRTAQEAGEIRRAGQSRGNELPSAAQILGLKHKSYVHGYYVMASGSDAEFNAAICAAKAEGSMAQTTVERYLADVAKPKDADWIPDGSDRTNEAAVRRRALIKDMALHGNSSRQIADTLSVTAYRVRELAREMNVTIRADQAMGGGRRNHDSNRIAQETADTLDGLATAITLVNLDDIDPARAKNWAASIRASIRTLTRFEKQLIKETQ